ncbi:Las1-domain-containing protein [Bimuria novae-zelandiae CBS 107.79]|uniref:Las1-domain-containing protein n=1 Tax=Bimuria novae-zelandiae CBS 107.79 TaxID=1447943 RepID=A0A6A5UX80_9PLEO|nr:Las1-domain-containing protein [Bimuria novae-zelandiae CBS 107.79]
MAPMFVVTPWRDTNELLALRRDLLAADPGAIDRREEAANKVLAWRGRKLELPLLLESTADIVEARLRDEKQELASNALRLLYATAISRFVTGLLDTQTDLTRLALPSQATPLIPVTLRETRHRIVHRHLPSLAELKRATQESLDWLWEHYWSRLDALLAPTPTSHQLSQREVKERLQGILKTYVKERKVEIKSKSKNDRTADNAVGSYLTLGVPRDVKTRALLDHLVQEKNILPVGKKLGTSMAGAYLIWTPFLVSLSNTEASFLQGLTEHMVEVLSAPARKLGSVEEDPAREGMHDWLVHILSSAEWRDARRRGKTLLNDVLGLCFTTPTYWTLTVAATLLETTDLPERKSWLAVLKAARNEDVQEVEQPLPPKPINGPDGMEVDAIDAGLPVSVSNDVGITRGPQKYPGLWRPQPIGWISPGWDVDE